MNELYEMEGKIWSFVTASCMEISKKGLFSLYGGLPAKLQTGMYVHFQYRKKQVNGKTYNNIVEGSIEIIDSPKDISEQYSQDEEVAPNNPHSDTNIMIARQVALKCAEDFVSKLSKSETVSPDELVTNILWYARKFEEHLLK